MYKLVKKSLIVIYSLLSTLLAYIPIVNAQTEEVVKPVVDALKLGLGLIADIMAGILDAFKGNSLYAKAFIAIFMGTFFYYALRETPVFKGKSGLAGMFAFAIGIITAYAVPDSFTEKVFSSQSPFFVPIICAFLLLIFHSDSRLSHTVRGIIYLALTVLFSTFVLEFTGLIQLILSGFTIIWLVLSFYNFVKIGSGIGPSVGETAEFLFGKNILDKAVPDAFGKTKKNEEDLEKNKKRTEKEIAETLQAIKDQDDIEKALDSIINLVVKYKISKESKTEIDKIIININEKIKEEDYFIQDFKSYIKEVRGLAAREKELEAYDDKIINIAKSMGYTKMPGMKAERYLNFIKSTIQNQLAILNNLEKGVNNFENARNGTINLLRKAIENFIPGNDKVFLDLIYNAKSNVHGSKIILNNIKNNYENIAKIDEKTLFSERQIRSVLAEWEEEIRIKEKAA